MDEGNKRKVGSERTQEIEGKEGGQARRKGKERRDSQGRDGHIICRSWCIGRLRMVGYVCMYVCRVWWDDSVWHWRVRSRGRSVVGRRYSTLHVIDMRRRTLNGDEVCRCYPMQPTGRDV